MKRIQRKRTKGWRMPEGAVYVGRPSRWGNPFRPSREMRRREARLTHRQRAAIAQMRVANFEAWLRDDHSPWFGSMASTARKRLLDALPTLRTATALVCWCPLDQPCHADVLIELLRAER